MCDFFWELIDNVTNLVQNKAVLAANDDEIHPSLEQVLFKIGFLMTWSHGDLHRNKPILNLQEDVNGLPVAIAFNDGVEF